MKSSGISHTSRNSDTGDCSVYNGRSDNSGTSDEDQVQRFHRFSSRTAYRFAFTVWAESSICNINIQNCKTAINPCSSVGSVYGTSDMIPKKVTLQIGLVPDGWCNIQKPVFAAGTVRKEFYG